MIGKVHIGNRIRGLLNYCYYESNSKNQSGKNNDFSVEYVRGRYIFSQNLDLLYLPDGRIDIDSVIDQIQNVTELNRNCISPCWHQTFSFPIGENLSDEKMALITIEFSNHFGFNNNQLIAFRHLDKSHHHFHIIANRLNINGKKAVSTSNNYYRIYQFCRLIEQNHNLSVIESKGDRTNCKNRFALQSRMAEKLRFIIDSAIKNCNSLDEFSKYLEDDGIKILTGRGIAFIDSKKGISFKGSDLGRNYSYRSILSRLRNIPQKIEFDSRERSFLLERIMELLHTKPTFKTFQRHLGELGYSIRILRKTRINCSNDLDIVFRSKEIPNKVVLGSDLGVRFSLNQHTQNQQFNSINHDNLFLEQKPLLIFDTVQSVYSETEKDLSKIDRNLLKNKTTENQGIITNQRKNQSKKPRK